MTFYRPHDQTLYTTCAHCAHCGEPIKMTRVREVKRDWTATIVSHLVSGLEHVAGNHPCPYVYRDDHWPTKTYPW